MVTIEFVNANGITSRFTVPDLVAFTIIEALKKSSDVKKVTYRHWIERPAET
jgi:hypothetical protein